MSAEGAFHEIRSGRRLHVFHHEVAGARKRILLIHGSLANWRQFEDQIEFFRKTQPDASLVAADAYGCGRSPKPEEWEAYSEEEIFLDYVALFRQFFVGSAEQGANSRPSPTNVIVGHSFGTCIALRLMCHDETRDHIHGVVLLGGRPSRPPSMSHPLFFLPHWVCELLRGVANRAFLAAAFHPDTDERTKERASAESGENPWHVIQAFYRQVRWDLEQHWGELSARVAADPACPVMLLVGEADGLTPPAESDAIFDRLKQEGGEDRAEGLWRWWQPGDRAHGDAAAAPLQRRVVRQASHQVMQEQPAEVNALLAGWLDAAVPGWTRAAAAAGRAHG